MYSTKLEGVAKYQMNQDGAEISVCGGQPHTNNKKNTFTSACAYHSHNHPGVPTLS